MKNEMCTFLYKNIIFPFQEPRHRWPKVETEEVLHNNEFDK